MSESANLRTVIQEEFLKSAVDSVHFFKKYAKIQHPMKGKILFNLYPFQEDTVRLFKEHRFNIVLKSRQMGISTLCAGHCLHQMIFNEDFKILVIATKQDVAKNLVQKVQIMWEFLPAWMKQGLTIVNNNKLSLVFSNGSEIKAVSSSPDAARSEALSLLVLDEFAFVDCAEEIWTSAQSTLATGGSCIMLSTPNGIGNLFHQTWQHAVEGVAEEGLDKFNPILLPWHLHPDRDQKWRDNQDSLLGKRLASQECDADFLSSGHTVIESEILQWYEKEHIQDPVERRGIGGDYWIWKYPDFTRTYLVCLPEGESVLTENGIKNVEHITYEDRLVDIEGNSTEIEDLKIRKYDGDLFEIKVSNTFRTTKFTDEHPIFSSKPVLKRNYNRQHERYRFNERYWDFNFDFTPSKDIEIGDWLKVPNIYFKKYISNEEILSKWSKYDDNTRIDFKINHCPLFDENFWWFVGLWLAEGWTYNDKLNNWFIFTAHNSNELDIIERVEKVCKSFDRSLTKTNSLTDKSTRVQFSSKQIGQFLHDNFGKGAGNKSIPEWVKFLPDNFRKQLVLGYLEGDGCTTECLSENRGKRKNDITICFVSISLKLLEDFQDILFSLGFISSLKRCKKAGITNIKGRDCSTKDKFTLDLGKLETYRLLHELDYRIDRIVNIPQNNLIIKDCFFENDKSYIYFRVKDVKKIPFSGEVYNFTTKSGTFMCENIPTHNCADPARGDGEDYSAFHVIDVETVEQVAEYKGKIDTQMFGNLLVSVATEYNNATLIIDNRNIGWSTIQYVIDSGYKNLYYSFKNDPYLDENIHLRKAYDLKQKEDMIPGYSITVKSRPVLVSKLDIYFRDKAPIIHSKRFLNELYVFMWIDGKPQAQRGYNDDLVMSFCMGLMIRDTSLKLRMLGIDLVKRTLKTTHKTVFKPQPIGQAKWEMNVGRQGNKENLKWLL